MRKVVSFIMAMALVTSCCTAFAANGTITDQDKTDKAITVTFSVDEKYTVTIPAEANAEVEVTGANATTATKVGDVVVSDVKVGHNKEVQVTVSSGNGWKMQTTEQAEVGYKLYKETEASHEITGEVIAVTTAKQTDTQSLYLKLDTEPTEAGDYKDTLTFKATVGDVEP